MNSLVRMTEWDIDSKVINVEVRVNPDVLSYDTEDVANCTISLDYMKDNKIRLIAFCKANITFDVEVQYFKTASMSF